MPRVSRRRRLDAAPGDVWRVVSDPYHLPRWWPRTQRVENVTSGAAKGRKWTQVLETRDGRGVRADFRCVSAAEGDRYVYEQLLDETPFERIFSEVRTEIRMEPDGAGTRVTATAEQRLRGLSKLGGFMMRRAMRRNLNEALAGLDEITGGGTAEAAR